MGVLSKYLQNEYTDLQTFMHNFSGTDLLCKSWIYTYNLNERKSGVTWHRPNRRMGKERDLMFPETLKRRRNEDQQEDSVLSVYIATTLDKRKIIEQINSIHKRRNNGKVRW